MAKFAFDLITSLIVVGLSFYWSCWFVKSKSRRIRLKEELRWLPNTLSLLRGLYGFIFYFIYPYIPTVALLLFNVAIVSDFTDGKFARAGKVETQLGKFFDPLGDKVLYLGILFHFADEKPYLSMSILIVFTLTELFSQCSRFWLNKKGKDMSAVMVGKVKATIAFILTYLVIIYDQHSELIKHLLNYMDNIVDLSSLLICLNMVLVMCIILSVLSCIFKIVPQLD